MPDFAMSARELDAVARQINKQVQSKRRTHRVVTAVRTATVATAVLLIFFLGINWLVNRNYQPEPVAPAPPQPTAVPTAILAKGMKYVDLTAVTPEALEQIEADNYTQTISQVATAVEYDLFVPTQLKQNLTFVGTMVNPENKAVEMVFRGPSKLLGGYRLWILSQQPVAEFSKNEAQFPMQSAFNIKEGEEVTETILTVYEVHEYVWSMGDATMVITVAWQENGRQYTLSIVTPSKLDPDIVMDTARGLHLTRFDP